MFASAPSWATWNRAIEAAMGVGVEDVLCPGADPGGGDVGVAALQVGGVHCLGRQTAQPEAPGALMPPQVCIWRRLCAWVCLAHKGVYYKVVKPETHLPEVDCSFQLGQLR